MKLYFGNTTAAVTTIMIVALIGFIGYSIWNRTSINSWGRRSLFVLVYGLVVCCFAAAIIILAAIATPIARSQHMREIWFYVMSGGVFLKVAVMEISRRFRGRILSSGRSNLSDQWNRADFTVSGCRNGYAFWC